MPNISSTRLLSPGDEALLIRLAGKFYNSQLSAAEAEALLTRKEQYMLCILERGALAGLKTTSYAENVLALEHAHRHGGDEAVDASGGYGMLFGPRSTKKERKDFAEQLKA